MFECKICLQKDLRLADKDAEIKRLMEQVSMLREMVSPSKPKAPSLQDREMDQILSGENEVIQVSEDEINNEAAQLFLGSYDSSQIEVE